MDLRFNSRFSESARDLIRQLCRAEPSERMPLDQVENHPFIREHAHEPAPRPASATGGAGGMRA